MLHGDDDGWTERVWNVKHAERHDWRVHERRITAGGLATRHTHNDQSSCRSSVFACLTVFTNTQTDKVHHGVRDNKPNLCNETLKFPLF